MSDNPFLNSFVQDSEAPAPKKAARTTSAAPSASQSEKDQETLLALKTELENYKRRLEEDTAALATTREPKYRKELEARIASYPANINSLNKELAGHPLGKTVATSASAAAPASAAASAPAQTSSNPYSKRGTWVDETDQTPKPKDSGSLAGPEHAAAVAGGVAGALYGTEAELNPSGRAAKMMERMYGLAPGSLAELEQIKNPNAPLTDAEAARLLAERQLPDRPIVPEEKPIVASEAPPAEPKATAMEKWAASQVGENSVIPKNVIAEATSNYANDPTGAPQIIKEQASKTRLARTLAPAGSVQVTPGGVEYVVSKGGGARNPDVSYKRMQHFPANTRPSAVLANPALFPQVEAAPAPGALPVEPAPVSAPEAAPPLEQMRAKLEENIRRAGGMANIAQRGANLGLNTFAGAMGGYQGLRGLMDMYAHGVTPQNALETTAGAGALTGVKYPKVGLPVAGLATMGQAGLNMQEQGPTAQNLAQGVSGAGMTIMPKAPVFGMAMQAPALTLEMKQWLAAHPDWWKRINAFQTPAQAPQ
jgi:hypothetical protein